MNKREIVIKYFIVLIGIFIVAIAFNLFFVSNNLAAYGISGLSIIFNDIWKWEPSLFILLSNIFLVIISFIFLGKEYTKKTIVGAILFPIFIKLTSFLPNYIDLSKAELLSIAIVGGAISGLGSGLIYKNGYGTAGTDITNQLLVKYFKLSMGKAITIGDGCVVLIGGLAFGIETMMYALITLLIMSYVCNRVMIGISRSKTFYIVTEKVEEIKEYIIKYIKSDVSIFSTSGGYLKKEKYLIMSVIDTRKYYILKEGIRTIDSNAFISIVDSYEVINKKKFQ